MQMEGQPTHPLPCACGADIADPAVWAGGMGTIFVWPLGTPFGCNYKLHYKSGGADAGRVPCRTHAHHKKMARHI